MSACRDCLDLLCGFFDLNNVKTDLCLPDLSAESERWSRSLDLDRERDRDVAFLHFAAGILKLTG